MDGRAHKKRLKGRRFRRKLGTVKNRGKCSRRLVKEEEVKESQREAFHSNLLFIRIKQEGSLLLV